MSFNESISLKEISEKIFWSVLIISIIKELITKQLKFGDFNPKEKFIYKNDKTIMIQF